MERDLPQEAAERLLSGDLTPPPEGAETLAALLAAATAPARPDELAGEAAAMAAFRANPPAVRRWSLRRVLTIKVAALMTATVAAGGVALASSTGLLPNPFQPTPGSSQSPSGPSSPKDRSPAPGLSPDGPGHSGQAEAMRGLCHSYQAKPANERGKALRTPAFAALVSEAGGPEHVDAYCTQLLASPAPEKSKDKDGGPNKPPPSPPGPAVTTPGGPPESMPRTIPTRTYIGR